jgi:hypothetical protein
MHSRMQGKRWRLEDQTGDGGLTKPPPQLTKSIALVPLYGCQYYLA